MFLYHIVNHGFVFYLCLAASFFNESGCYISLLERSVMYRGTVALDNVFTDIRPHIMRPIIFLPVIVLVSVTHHTPSSITHLASWREHHQSSWRYNPMTARGLHNGWAHRPLGDVAAVSTMWFLIHCDEWYLEHSLWNCPELDQLTLVQIISRDSQPTSYYLGQYWSRSMSPYRRH